MNQNWRYISVILSPEMSSICLKIKNYFHISGSAVTLALKQTLGAAVKQPHILVS